MQFVASTLLIIISFLSLQLFLRVSLLCDPRAAYSGFAPRRPLPPHEVPKYGQLGLGATSLQFVPISAALTLAHSMRCAR
jgi:hypothetical protein